MQHKGHAMYAPINVAPAQGAVGGPSYRWLASAAVASCCMHVGLYATLLLQEHASPAPAPSREMIMEVNTVPPPPPPPPPPPEVKKAPAPTPKAPVPPRVTQAPPKAASPPPPNDAPAKPAAAAPVRIGLSLSSTSQSGTFAAPVGNSMAGQAARQAADPNQVQPYAGAKDFVPSYEVAEGPQVDAEPDLQAYYPEDARKQNIEAQVALTLTINEQGAVIAAKVLHGAGNGFDEAAVKAAKEKLHFKPARAHGHPVSTEITYKITFLLD